MGLLREHRIDAVSGNGAHVAGRREAEPVAKTHGERVAGVAGRPGIGEQRLQRLRILHGERAEPYAALIVARKPGGAVAGERKVFLPGAADDGACGALRRIGRAVIDAQIAAAAEGGKERLDGAVHGTVSSSSMLWAGCKESYETSISPLPGMSNKYITFSGGFYGKPPYFSGFRKKVICRIAFLIY